MPTVAELLDALLHKGRVAFADRPDPLANPDPKAGELLRRAFARYRHSRLEVRDRRAGHSQAVGKLLLCGTQLGPEPGDPPSQALTSRFWGHVPTHFADGGTATA